MFVAKAVKDLKPYTVSSHAAWEIKDKSAVLKLDWNESTIPPSPLVRERVLNHIDTENLNWYPDVDNSLLRSKIADYCDRSHDEVEYFASSDALHEYVIRVFCDPTDSILMLSPTYDNFRAVAESAGISVHHHQIDFFEPQNITHDSVSESLERVEPKIVYICNPNNPSGTVYDIALLEKLIEKHQDTLFLVDEAYFEFTKLTVTTLVSQLANLVVCRTFSKAFGLASFRVGYAISCKQNIAALRKVKNHKNISALAQVAALAALDDIEYMERYVVDVLVAKQVFVDFLKSIPALRFIDPKGGNFVLIDFGDFKHEIVNHLRSFEIFIRDFAHINNMEGFARITVGNQKQTQVVINKLSLFYSKT